MELADETAAARKLVAELHGRRRGAVGEPIPVRSLQGSLDSWFVPVSQNRQLIAFYQLTPELRLRRFSELGAEVELEDWTEPARVLARAKEAIRPGERPGSPMLAYDGNPDRLAWAVPIAGPDGEAWIFVAGRTAWRGSASRGAGEAT